MKAFSKITACCLAAVLLLSPLFVSGTGSEAQAPAASQSFTEAGSTAAAENSRFSLSVTKETGVLRLEDKQTGAVWWSNPEQADNDTQARAIYRSMLKSQLIISYIDSSDIIKTGNSYDDAADISLYTADQAVKAVYHFNDIGLELPIVYTLGEDRLSVRVVSSEIKETGENRLLEASVLPYMGAGGVDEDGYLFVADGQGAIIRFNNGKTYTDAYSGRVYGEERINHSSFAGPKNETVLLPCFGMKKGDQGFLGIISGAAEMAEIEADVSGKTNSYNSVGSRFIYRASESYMIQTLVGYIQEVLLNKAADKPVKEGFEVLYCFLDKGKSSYSDMAERFGRYLGEEGGLTRREARRSPLYLRIESAVQKQKTILGFPVKQITALTTFEEQQSILEELIEAGVSELEVRAMSLFSDQLKGKAPKNLKPLSVLGGKKGYEALLAFCTSSNIGYYADIETAVIETSGNGFSKSYDTVQNYDAGTARLPYFSNATGYLTGEYCYAIRPDQYGKLAERAAASAEKYGIRGLSVTGLTNQLYSDFGKNELNRAEAANYAAEALKKLGTGMMASAPNYYALPYLAKAADIPVTSSEYDIFDANVPFYSMALQDYVELATPAANLTSDWESMVLKAAETGMCLQFAVMREDNAFIKDTDLENSFSLDYSDWKDDIISSAARLQQISAATDGSRITGHELLGEGLTKTIYENGAAVLVNYTGAAVTAEGTTVEAKSFTVLEAGKGA